MEESMLEKAIGDVQLIKKVMARSAESILSMNKLFIWWGISFFSITLAAFFAWLIWHDTFLTPGGMSQLLLIAPDLTKAAAALIICLAYGKNYADVGINRQLLVLWLFLIGIDTIWPVFQKNVVIFQMGPIAVDYLRSNFIPDNSILLYGLGMFSTWLFTRLRLSGIMALIQLVLILILILNVLPTALYVTILSFITPLFLIMFGIVLSRSKKKYTEADQ